MRFGETDFLIFEGQTFTNAQLADKARRLAAGLQVQGLKVGDRVLVMIEGTLAAQGSFEDISRDSTVRRRYLGQGASHA